MELFKVNWSRKNPCTEKKKCLLPDYHCDNRTVAERLAAGAISAVVVGIVAYFFYRNIWASIPLIFVGVVFYKSLKVNSIKKQRNVLELQFKECILSVAGLLKAGYSIENAFRESEKDMELLFGANSAMVGELGIIRRGLVMNIPLEILLEDFASRSGSSHIEQFSQVFFIAKKTGGNMAEVIRTSAELIGRDIESRQEIKAVLSGRRMEQNIMKLMPFAIILYVGITSRGYFDSLYGNITGALIMTGCLVIYLFAYFLGDRVLDKIESES